MSLKSISLAAVLAGAMYLVGCGGGDSGPTNSPPQAILPVGAPFSITSGDIPYTIQLGGIDYDGNPLTYLFDSTTSQGGSVDVASGGLPDVEYTPEAVWLGGGGGVDSFTFRVSDGFVTSSAVLVYIGVDNDAPVAISQPSVAATEDTSLPITLTGSDPDLDAIVFQIETLPAGGALVNFNSATGEVTYVPDANENNTTLPGFDSFTFSVSDHILSSVVSATVTIDVAPVNDAPVANADVYTNRPFGLPVLVVALNNDTDVEGDNLTIVLAGFTQGGHGTVTHNATHDTFVYMPDNMYFGPDTFTYQITDGVLTSNIATVYVEVGKPVCQVYSWGRNDKGQLGIGSQGPNVSVPTSVRNVISIIRHGWDVWGGDEYTIFYDSGRNIFTCGENLDGLLADPGWPLRDYPRCPSSFGGSDVDAGSAHGIVATGMGSYATAKTWGTNDKHQLGNGTTDPKNSPTLVLTKDWEHDPNKIYPLMGVTAVAAGKAHSLAVTYQPGPTTYLTDDEWRVFSWGANNAGQLGQNNTDELAHAKEIVELQGADLNPVGLVALSGGNHIVDVVAFHNHSLALDDTGRVYAWGSNNECESAVFPPSARVDPPVYVGGGYKQIAAGEQHSYAVTIGGALYGWGRCDEGQLAHPISWPCVRHSSPQYMAIPGDEVLHVASGFDHGLAAAHETVNLVVTQSGTNSNNGDGTFTVTINTPPDLSGTDWTGGYVTHRATGEVGFILNHIDVDTVKIWDPGISATFDPVANWGGILDFTTQDWHVYAWGVDVNKQVTHPTLDEVDFPHLVNGPWEGNAQRRPIRVGAGPFNSFAMIHHVTITAP